MRSTNENMRYGHKPQAAGFRLLAAIGAVSRRNYREHDPTTSVFPPTSEAPLRSEFSAFLCATQRLCVQQLSKTTHVQNSVNGGSCELSTVGYSRPIFY